MLHRVQLHEQEPQHAGLACGHAGHQCYLRTVDSEDKSNIDSGTFRPLQLAAAQAYRNSAEWHEEANIHTYARRRKLAEEIMHTLGCTFDPEQVGMFLWGRIPDSYADVEDLTEKILHEARVFITPGFIFGSNGKRYIRISLCAKEPQLEEALKRIQAVMNK